MHTCKTLGLAALAVTVSALALPAAAEDLSGTRFDVHADYLWGHVQPSGFSDAGDTALAGYDSNSSGVGVDLRHDWQNDSTVFGVFGSFTTFSATGGASVAKTVTVEDTSGGGENTESKKAPRSVIETEGTTI
ncbi:MAG: hypothetical protein JF615_01755, partial [Asticcacaulis sp.]|nr:hypothetical protein [Asticcacaulis sp.]